MRSVLLLLSLLLLPGGARAAGTTLTINRTVTQTGIRVTLEKITLALGTDGRTMLAASLRVTDAAGRPFTVIRDPRLTLVEPGLASVRDGSTTFFFDPARVMPHVLIPRGAKRARTIALDLLAARVAPTRVWVGVPVQSSKEVKPSAPLHRGRTETAMVNALYCGTDTDLLGTRTRSAFTAEVTEWARSGRWRRAPLQDGVLQLTGGGLWPVRASVQADGRQRLYGVQAVLRGDQPAPRALTLRFYSATAVTQALKPFHVVFRDVPLP